MNRIKRAEELLDGTPHDLDDLVFVDDPDNDKPPGYFFLIKNPTKDDEDEANLWATEVEDDGEMVALGTVLLRFIPIDNVPREVPPELAERDEHVFWVAYDYESALRGEFEVLEEHSTIGLE